MADCKSNFSARAGAKRFTEWLFTAPSLLWLAVFFVIPSLLVFAIAFKTADPAGGIGSEWTLETFANVLRSDYVSVLWRTVWVSCAIRRYAFARDSRRVLDSPASARNTAYWLLLVIIIPLWTNFLIRIFAWRVLLHPDGFLRAALLKLGIISDDVFLLNNLGAVITVSVYTCLPFAILPIYAAAEKFNFSLIEAARDLGASRFKAFVSIFIPGIKRGIYTAIMVVFIPAMGSYAIPDLVGGVDGEMLGNKIAVRASANRNLPEAAALAALLSVIISVPVLLVFLKQKGVLKNVINIRRSSGDSTK